MKPDFVPIYGKGTPGILELVRLGSVIGVQVFVPKPNHEDSAGWGGRIQPANAGTKNLLPLFPANRNPWKSIGLHIMKLADSSSRKNRDTNRDTK
jgi:hypothetical protein